MALTDLKTILDGTGLPVAYNCFKDEQSLPFVCFLETGTNNLFADGKTYKIISDIAIELYTAQRDLTSEGKVEKALDDALICWNKTIEYIDDEQCYFILYEIQI